MVFTRGFGGSFRILTFCRTSRVISPKLCHALFSMSRVKSGEFCHGQCHALFFGQKRVTGYFSCHGRFFRKLSRVSKKMSRGKKKHCCSLRNEIEVEGNIVQVL